MFVDSKAGKMIDECIGMASHSDGQNICVPRAALYCVMYCHVDVKC